ncbi:MAG: hypothetical protein LBB46_06450, partial [Coriobacteriaceae bacterium]|nr:hypothetical protein [Coriobacteriaceae bacterium]
LKVGHHGARVALDEKSAGRLSPRIALISVGANNSYGHPSPEALDLLEGLSCTVVRSDEAGDVVCKFTDGGIGVRVLG